MTLLELLLKELPSHGGWPKGMRSVVQSKIDSELHFYHVRWQQGQIPSILHDFGMYLDNPVHIQRFSEEYIVVTKEQYESASRKYFGGK